MRQAAHPTNMARCMAPMCLRLDGRGTNERDQPHHGVVGRTMRSDFTMKPADGEREPGFGRRKRTVKIFTCTSRPCDNGVEPVAPCIQPYPTSPSPEDSNALALFQEYAEQDAGRRYVAKGPRAGLRGELQMSPSSGARSSRRGRSATGRSANRSALRKAGWLARQGAGCRRAVGSGEGLPRTRAGVHGVRRTARDARSCGLAEGGAAPD